MVWQKGQSGNPAGRAKRGQTLVDALRAALTVKARKVIAEKAIAMAEEGQMEAIKFIFERIDGKVTQPMSIDIEQHIIEAAEREGVDPTEAVAMAQRIIKEDRWS